MITAGVKPLYLHQLDAAPGTARFHVPIAEGQRLLAALRGRVTGLARNPLTCWIFGWIWKGCRSARDF